MVWLGVVVVVWPGLEIGLWPGMVVPGLAVPGAPGVVVWAAAPTARISANRTTRDFIKNSFNQRPTL